MDFMQRGSHTPTVANVGNPADPGAAHHGKNGRHDDTRWFRFANVALLFSITVLLVAVVISLATGGITNESKYVNNNEFQAVFLNGGQVYFGNIKNLNDKYVRMTNIYYLRVNQTVQPNQTNNQSSNDVSLVKLGCELHGPEDQMVINRDQVTFWENLKSDGQVAKAVADYVKANPNGQQCTTSNSTSSSNSTSTTPTSPTTPAPSTSNSTSTTKH